MSKIMTTENPEMQKQVPIENEFQQLNNKYQTPSKLSPKNQYSKGNIMN